MFYYNIRTANVNVYYQVSLHCMISLPIQPIQLPPSVWRYRAMRRTFSEVQLRDGQSERGQASQLFEQKCFILNSFYKHFCEFWLARAELPSSCKRSDCFRALARYLYLSAASHHFCEFLPARADTYQFLQMQLLFPTLHDIFTLKCLEIPCNARKLSAYYRIS